MIYITLHSTWRETIRHSKAGHLRGPPFRLYQTFGIPSAFDFSCPVFHLFWIFCCIWKYRVRACWGVLEFSQQGLEHYPEVGPANFFSVHCIMSPKTNVLGIYLMVLYHFHAQNSKKNLAGPTSGECSTLIIDC